MFKVYFYGLKSVGFRRLYEMSCSQYCLGFGATRELPALRTEIAVCRESVFLLPCFDSCPRFGACFFVRRCANNQLNGLDIFACHDVAFSIIDSSDFHFVCVLLWRWRWFRIRECCPVRSAISIDLRSADGI